MFPSPVLSALMDSSYLRLEKMMGRVLVKNDVSENPISVGFKGIVNCYSGSVWEFFLFSIQNGNAATTMDRLEFIFSLRGQNISHFQLGKWEENRNLIAFEATERGSEGISLGRCKHPYSKKTPCTFVDSI